MQKKVQILLVEDELIIADYLQDCLEKLGYSVCGICIDYDEAVAALQVQTPDIVIVDITLLGSKSGIEVGDYIRNTLNIPFIFATSHGDKATIDKATAVMPYAYLIKPFSEEDLYAVIETALKQYGRQIDKSNLDAKNEVEQESFFLNNAVFIRHKGRFIKLVLDELMYVEANDNYCNLYTANTVYSLKGTLKSLSEFLPDSFLRIHRSFVINMHHLQGFDMELVSIANKELPIGKNYLPLLLERLKFLQG